MVGCGNLEEEDIHGKVAKTGVNGQENRVNNEWKRTEMLRVRL